jgi:WD40 repeat protein
MPTVAPLDLDGHCVWAGFVTDIPHFALADGIIHALDNGRRHVTAHDGLLCAALSLDGRTLISGGEDGRLVETRADGTIIERLALGRKWITSLASGPDGMVAGATGKHVEIAPRKGKTIAFGLERSAEGLAFAPKGRRIAVARYDGATLLYAAAGSQPVPLDWKGAHTGVSFSPDGSYVVTTMQENALHGWRLADNRHMRMTGYPGKVKSWSWSAKGKWLATSGAPAAIVWPFSGKDGPMGKSPLELGTRGDQLVTQVCCHPTEDITAIGYSDGMILAARMSDGNEVLLRRPGKGAITSMGWDGQGFRIAYGSETGDCGVVDIRG